MFLTGLDRVLNDSGVKWTARPGWATRTAHRGGLREVRAVMWHTTETATSAFRNSTAPTLGYVESGLGYNLYNILIGRDGRAYLIAAGTAAHAGKGSGHGMPRDQANYYSFGISFDSNNNTTPVNAAQLETGARLGAAIDREWKSSISHVMHGEWAPARRSDPTKIPGGWGALRAAINRGYWRNAPSNPTTPSKGEIVSASDFWRYRGTDYVNDNPTTQQAKLARAHQYSFEQPGRVWGHREHDFVNEAPNSYGFMLARIHQYTWEMRAELRGLRAAFESLADELGKAGTVDPETVKKAARDGVAAALSDLEADVTLTINTDQEDQ